MADPRLRRQSSTSSHPSLYTTSSRNSSTSDVFSDQHAIDGDPTIADGFRPAATPRSRPRTPPRGNRRSMASRIDDGHRDSMERRSLYENTVHASSSRNSVLHDLSTHPSQRSTTSRTQRSQPEMSQRPVSIVSSFSIPRAQSPFVGASGPSHPYAMYPQETSLNRSSTTSTIRPQAERPYSGPRQPIHPYALYPQSAVPETPFDPLASSRDIVTEGFPGLSHGLTRRIGPDGEDVDELIASDGYTEQLPPYTRYPDTFSPKERFGPGQDSLLSPDMTTTQTLASPREGLLEAQAAEEDEAEAEGSDESTYVATEGTDESSRVAASRAKWARKGRKRLFGGKVPAWAMCLAMLVVVFLAATMGGLIGRYFPHNYSNSSPSMTHNQGNYPDDWNATGSAIVMTITTTLIDASPLPSIPAHLPRLPTGNFGFTLDPASEASSACLTSPGQSQAWSCPSDGFMLFNITPSDIGPSQVILDWSGDLGYLTYGPQPPSMTQPIGLTLMEDVEQPQLGPAYFFQSAYNKTVVLPNNILNTTSSSTPKRSLAQRLADAATSPILPRSSHVQPGDQPWICYWNATLLEGFIYIEQADPASAEASSLASAGSITFSSAQATPYTGLYSEASPASSAGAAGASSASSVSEVHGSTGTLLQSSTTPTPPPPPPPSTSSNPAQTYAARADFGYSPYPSLSPYPMSMKFAERRVPGNPVKPYCQQMNVASDLSLSPAYAADGKPNVVVLDECEPKTQQVAVGGGTTTGKTLWRRGLSGSLKGRSLNSRSGDEGGACLCEWMIS